MFLTACYCLLYGSGSENPRLKKIIRKAFSIKTEIKYYPFVERSFYSIFVPQNRINIWIVF